ncbi:hypothetical protein Scep_002452 [Stephania cephalantha]|uniref:Uncharacterized protein n=1 Tax=Stephania cephalantha TaxID=152367 RepID=A0AAP0Q8S8_9MAGN
MATNQLYNIEAIEKMLILAEENGKLEVTLLEKDKDINMKDGVIAHNAEILSKNEIEISQLKATNNRLMAKVSSLETTNEEALALREKCYKASKNGWKMKEAILL